MLPAVLILIIVLKSFWSGQVFVDQICVFQWPKVHRLVAISTFLLMCHFTVINIIIHSHNPVIERGTEKHTCVCNTIGSFKQ